MEWLDSKETDQVRGTLMECYTYIAKVRRERAGDGFMRFEWSFQNRPINHKKHQAEMSTFTKSLGNAVMMGREPTYRILVRFTDV